VGRRVIVLNTDKYNVIYDSIAIAEAIYRDELLLIEILNKKYITIDIVTWVIKFIKK
jgi:hypothetical protein